MASFFFVSSAPRLSVPRSDTSSLRPVDPVFFRALVSYLAEAVQLFQLAPTHPDDRLTRTLTLLAKSLQNLASLIEFDGMKEHCIVIFSICTRTHHTLSLSICLSVSTALIESINRLVLQIVFFVSPDGIDMTEMNPYIVKNMDAMRGFLEKISVLLYLPLLGVRAPFRWFYCRFS